MVFGFFSKERAFQRTIKKATNQLAQSEERWAAMEKLRDEGSDEAFFHLLRRFTFSYNKTLQDEQEKEWVVENLSAKGDRVLPALRRYLKSSAQVAYPLRILERVGNPEQILDIVDEVLAGEDPGYTRDPNKRIQFLDWLRDWSVGSDEQIVSRVLPYLADFDENSRHAAVEALAVHPTPDTVAPLLDRLVSEDEDSRRIKNRIAEIVAEAAFDIANHKSQLTPLLDDVLTDYRIQRNKLVRK